jgi:hypothetical protein
MNLGAIVVSRESLKIILDYFNAAALFNSGMIKYDYLDQYNISSWIGRIYALSHSHDEVGIFIQHVLNLNLILNLFIIDIGGN